MSTIAIVGRTGSGKSYTAKGMIESDLCDGMRVCVIDPTGVWWGLRLTADGKGPAFPVVIFGGDHADVPLSPAQGERLGELVAVGTVPQSVIDISEMSGNQQTSFLTAFLEALYAKNRAPLILVMDEADVMAPQNPMPEQRRMQGAVNKIVRRGRVKGFRPIMITQRPAVLDKSVLSQIDTLIAMRLTSPQDRKAIDDWVKGNADADQARAVLDSLASLDRGEGWFWAPADDRLSRQTFPAITTFDSGRTPEPGEAVRQVTPLTITDLDGIRTALQVEQVEKKPAGGAGRPASADPAMIAAAEKRGYERGYADGQRHGFIRGAEKSRHAMGDALNNLRVEDDGFVEAAASRAIAQPNPKIEARRQPEITKAPPPSGESRMSPTGQKILEEILRAAPRALTFGAAAKRAGASPRSSQFRQYEREVRNSRMVVVDDGRLRAADGAGKPDLGPGDDPVEAWAQRLTPSQAAMMRAIAGTITPLSKEDIADRAGVSRTSSGLTSGLRELLGLELAQRQPDGRFALHPDMRSSS